MEAIAIMPSELDSLRDHFDRRIEEVFLPRMDRLEAKVDAVAEQARQTNGRLRAAELWQARWEGMKSGAGGSWQVLMAVLSATVAVVAVVLGHT